MFANKLRSQQTQRIGSYINQSVNDTLESKLQVLSLHFLKGFEQVLRKRKNVER